jgi:hypothetical protein
MLWTACAYDSAQLESFTKWRWAVGLLGAVLALVARPLLARRAARRPAPELLGSAVRIGVAVVASVVAADVVLRIAMKPQKAPGLEMPLSVMDEEYGWHHETSRTTFLDYFGGPSVEYVTDATGNRVRSAESPTDFTQPAILFPGESITLGLGLPYDSTYTALVERRTGIRAVNLGVTGYSNDQAYARLAQQLPRFAKPLAVVTLVVQVQLLRNVERRITHHIPREDGSVEIVPASSRFFVNSPLRDLVERKIGYHSTEYLRRAREVIRATAREARSRGAYALFVFTNWATQCLPYSGGPPLVEHELFDGLDVPYVRVDLDSGSWDASIDHPGVRAHEQLAEVITRALDGAGVLPH